MKYSLGVQGIGGRNCFSAGVFYAMLKNKSPQPSIMSISSGAIRTTFNYLKEDQAQLKKVWFEKIKDHEEKLFLEQDLKWLKNTPGIKQHKSMLDFMKLNLKGIDGVFKPKFSDQFHQFFNPLHWAKIAQGPDLFFETYLPADVWQSDLDPKFIEEAYQLFNHHKVGIVMNAYDMKEGKSVLFLNKKAIKMLEDTRFNIAVHHKEFICEELTPEGIRGALQLFQYGTYKYKNYELYDGAYMFNPFIQPLKIEKKLFLIVASCVTKPPDKFKTALDIQSKTTRLMFQNVIHNEINSIDLINKLIDEGEIKESKRIHKIDLKLIEPNSHVDYWDFFSEKSETFEEGEKAALSSLIKI